MKSALVFGAGNIGRSFIGKAFAKGGWKVIFVDVDPLLVDALNERQSYAVVVKRENRADEVISVDNVSAINGRDIEAVSRALINADCLACCVGKSALPRILPNLAKGLIGRHEAHKGPVDLIIAENDREAAQTVRTGLESLLPSNFPLASSIGLVQTSIGKMVPIMRAEDLAADRLRVFAEEYDSLIADRRGFLNSLPDLPSLLPVENISAYVDRKLFVHNLGHAAVAWLGFSIDASKKLVSEAIDLPGYEKAPDPRWQRLRMHWRSNTMRTSPVPSWKLISMIFSSVFRIRRFGTAYFASVAICHESSIDPTEYWERLSSAKSTV